MPTVKVFNNGVEVAMIRWADTQGIWKAVNDAINSQA
jgi:hypothetical protein